MNCIFYNICAVGCGVEWNTEVISVFGVVEAIPEGVGTEAV